MDNNGNTFRQVPTGNVAPSPTNDMRQPAHPQQIGMTAIPHDKLHTWNFHYVSQMDGKTYEGQFTCKKLSIMEMARMGVRKVQLNGGYHFDESKPGVGIDETIDSLNSMIAHLEIAIIQAPAWFNPENLYDPMLVNLIYQEVGTFENSFFRSQRSGSEVGPSGSDDRSGESKESGSVGHIAEVGGRAVQPSLDP